MLGRSTRRWVGRAGMILAGLLPAGAGPWFYPDNCATIPKGAIPAPPGAHLQAWLQTEAAKAAEDAFVVYRHEWFMGGLTLGPYGQCHLGQIARRLPTVPFAVVLQPDCSPELNEARRQILIRRLAECGILDAPERVVVAPPAAEGLYGDEAVLIFARMISGRGAGGGFGRGGFGGGGFGGGGLGGGFGVGGAGFSSGFGGSLGITSRGY